jgi:putative redox protein
MIEVNVTYEGELRCKAIHGPSGESLHTDAPVDNNGRGESFSPTDLVATALATCMATVIGIIGKRKAINLTGMKVRVEKHMSTDAPRRIVRLPVEITLPLPPEHPERALLESAAHGCPVHQSVHPEIDKPITWHWVG